MPDLDMRGEDGGEREEATEWFWRIVDSNAEVGLPSIEEDALRLLCRYANRGATAEAEVVRLKEQVACHRRERDRAMELSRMGFHERHAVLASERDAAEAAAANLRGRVAVVGGGAEAVRGCRERSDLPAQ